MHDCVFCRIVASQDRPDVVARDDLTLAFMDRRQFNPGHVLVIPRRHLADVRELDHATGAALMAMVARITRAVSAAFPCEGISLWHSIGPAAFQEVPHLHIHVHPRRTGDGVLRVYPSGPSTPDRVVLQGYARRLREHLPAPQRTADLHVQLVPAEKADVPVVRNLSRLYIYDMSESSGWACPKTGLFGGCDGFFDDWQAGRNQAFVIRVDGELAGFAGTKQIDEGTGAHCVQEFFVLRKFRRKGVGRLTANMLFDAHPGPWRVDRLACNGPAVGFWTSVISGHPTVHSLTAAERPAVPAVACLCQLYWLNLEASQSKAGLKGYGYHSLYTRDHCEAIAALYDLGQRGEA